MAKSLKSIVKNQIAKLNSRQFLILVFVLLCFLLAFLYPDTRGRFFDFVGGLCQINLSTF